MYLIVSSYEGQDTPDEWHRTSLDSVQGLVQVLLANAGERPLHITIQQTEPEEQAQPEGQRDSNIEDSPSTTVYRDTPPLAYQDPVRESHIEEVTSDTVEIMREQLRALQDTYQPTRAVHGTINFSHTYGDTIHDSNSSSDD